MRPLLLALTLAACALMPACAPAAPRRGVVPLLQRVSVTVSVPGHWGSGVLLQRGEATYCWTAGHVAEHLKVGEQWKEAELLDSELEGGRLVNRSLGNARLLRISDAEAGDDFALLRLNRPVDGPGATFYLADHIPGVGTRLLHVGSFLGIDGSNSFSTGVVSQVGRILYGQVFDQTDAAYFPGSSGGGIFLEDGRCIGMLLRGSGQGFGYYGPVRRMRQWAERQGLSFALDPSRPVPGDLDERRVTDGEGGGA